MQRINLRQMGKAACRTMTEDRANALQYASVASMMDLRWRVRLPAVLDLAVLDLDRWSAFNPLIDFVGKEAKR